jgi:hypothetical protein
MIFALAIDAGPAHMHPQERGVLSRYWTLVVVSSYTPLAFLNSIHTSSPSLEPQNTPTSKTDG